MWKCFLFIQVLVLLHVAPKFSFAPDTPLILAQRCLSLQQIWLTRPLLCTRMASTRKRRHRAQDEEDGVQARHQAGEDSPRQTTEKHTHRVSNAVARIERADVAGVGVERSSSSATHRPHSSFLQSAKDQAEVLLIRKTDPGRAHPFAAMQKRSVVGRVAHNGSEPMGSSKSR